MDFLLSVKIHILEIGFCSDLRHGERDEAKKQQHERLCRILSGRSPDNCPATPSKHAHGRTTTPSDAMRRRTPFAADRILYHPPITLGRAGTLPASLMDTLKNKLKVTPSAAERGSDTGVEESRWRGPDWIHVWTHTPLGLMGLLHTCLSLLFLRRSVYRRFNQH